MFSWKQALEHVLLECVPVFDIDLGGNICSFTHTGIVLWLLKSQLFGFRSLDLLLKTFSRVCEFDEKSMCHGKCKGADRSLLHSLMDVCVSLVNISVVYNKCLIKLAVSRK